jgi:hypothetical protein
MYSAAPAEAAMAEASRDVRFILRLACTMLKNVETLHQGNYLSVETLPQGQNLAPHYVETP